jgi:hypothetical protein
MFLVKVIFSFFAVGPYREEPGGEGGIETVADGISDGQWTAYRTGGGKGVGRGVIMQ